MQSVRATPGAVKSKENRSKAEIFYQYGWIPEWPKGADCKSVSDAFEGSNPSPPINSLDEREFFIDYRGIEQSGSSSGS